MPKIGTDARGYTDAHEIGHAFDVPSTAGQPYKGPAAATDWAGQDCGQLIQQLSQSIAKIVDREVKARNQETEQVDKDNQARKAGGFWDQMTAGPLAEFQAKITEMGGTAREIGSGKQGILNRYAQYLDLGQTYVGMSTNLVSGVASNIINEVGVLNQATEALGIGTLVPTGQAQSCDPNLLNGTVGSVVRIAGRAVDNAVQSAFNVQATIGLAFDVIPNLYAGLMSLPVGSLSILLTNRETLLNRIEALVDDAISIALKIKEDDYPFDHRAFILAIQAELQGADSDLGQVESILEAGGQFVEDLWDRANKTVWDASEDLLGTGAGGLVPGIAHLKIMQLLGYQKLLETLIDILEQRQAAFAQLVAAVGEFRAEFDNNADFKNLMAPLVQQVRCEIQQVIEDMDRTLGINGMLRFYLKEKQWGLQLLALANFMEGAGKLGKPLTTVNTGLDDIADEVSGAIGSEQESLIAAETYGNLLGLLGSFITEMKRKIVSNEDPQRLQSLGELIKEAVEELKDKTSLLHDMLAPLQAGFASEIGLTVLQAVSGIVSFMEEQGLDGMLDALKKGDFKSFFSANTVKTSLESTAKKAIGDVLACCEDNAGDGDTRDRLLHMNRVVAAFDRGKRTYDKYTGGYAVRYIRTTMQETVPNLQKLKADVQQVSRARCINKGEPGTGAGTGLILV